MGAREKGKEGETKGHRTFIRTILTRSVRITYKEKGEQRTLVALEDVASKKQLPVWSEFGHEARLLLLAHREA